MKGTIYSLGWEILSHAVYSLDLALSNYYLFRSFQHHLADTHFKSVKEVQNFDLRSKESILSTQSHRLFFERGFINFPIDREKYQKMMANISNIDIFVSMFVFFLINESSISSKKHRINLRT